MSNERMFPVLYGYGRDEQLRKATGSGWPQEVPWSLLAPHERQALRNHSQTLERLAERGGLGLCEMVADPPKPRPQCNCPGGTHKGWTGCPLNSVEPTKGAEK